MNLSIHYMTAKKVLLNAMHLSGNFSGVHRYTEKLIRHLRNSKYHIEPIQPLNGAATSRLPRIKRVWYEQTKLDKDFKSGNYDLYHATNYVLPLFWKAPSVLTVHDTITLDYPELCKNDTAIYYGLLLKKSIRKAKKVLAVSEQVKQDIIRHTNISENRVKVSYLGTDPDLQHRPKEEELKRVREKYNLPERYFLFVGNLEPKKNLSRLVEAFHLLLPELHEKDQLIIVGQRGWKYQSIYKTIERLKIQSRVKLLGYVPQADLAALYKLASVFAFPSLYEGFGLPAIEAMACGIPTLVSNRGSLPEITGGFARQVNPLDVSDISMGLFEQLTQSNQERIRSAHQWARKYNWENTASTTVEAYEEVLKNPSE